MRLPKPLSSLLFYESSPSTFSVLGISLAIAGVSAGMDMSLYFVSQVLGNEVASKVAQFAEYNGQWEDWQLDPWGAKAA